MGASVTDVGQSMLDFGIPWQHYASCV